VVERVNEQIGERGRLEEPYRLCGFFAHVALPFDRGILGRALPPTLFASFFQRDDLS
jgi:hypothetical protein